jgi:predicted DNA-binding helix-hairpin-helix protein
VEAGYPCGRREIRRILRVLRGWRRNSRDGKGLGSTTGSGICHAYTPDGRCVSLLKVLLTNFCVYDCAFCINRLSSNTPRARFKVEEIVTLTLGFYRRNMIEGLFLSSGIAKSKDHTMEEMVRVAETLRRDHDFRGYIHLKAIAGASQDLMERAGRATDRLSVNVELPVDEALVRLAPQKDALVIRKAMGRYACLPGLSIWPIWFADIRSRPATICFMQRSSDFGRRRASWR